MLARRSLAVSQGPRVEQSPTPTINRERVLINFSVIPQFCRRGGAWLRPPLPYPLAQKIFPRTAGGPAMQAPTSKRQGLRKNSFALLQFHRRGEHCSPALAAVANTKIFSRTAGGPAMQAPTSERQGLCKNSTALSKFHRRGEHCSPALAAAANLKISPPHRCGPAVQAPTSERFSLA